MYVCAQACSGICVFMHNMQCAFFLGLPTKLSTKTSVEEESAIDSCIEDSSAKHGKRGVSDGDLQTKKAVKASEETCMCARA